MALGCMVQTGRIAQHVLFTLIPPKLFPLALYAAPCILQMKKKVIVPIFLLLTRTHLRGESNKEYLKLLDS